MSSTCVPAAASNKLLGAALLHGRADATDLETGWEKVYVSLKLSQNFGLYIRNGPSTRLEIVQLDKNLAST